MTYNFDEIVNRKNTNCEKYDGLKKNFGCDDLNPLWIADMDFKTPSFINDAIIKSSNMSLYGYMLESEELIKSIVKWQEVEHNFKVNEKDILVVSGVIPAYSACIEAFSEIGDEIIVQTPVYPPLFKFITLNNRKIVTNELINDNGYYKMDFEDLENKITSKTKILTLCSPHNPVGRVWSKEELEKLADICIKHNIIIISDEIHSDMSFKKFIPLASISSKIANQTITLNSAGKIFNIAGLNCGYVIISNKEFMKDFKTEADKRKISGVNYFGQVATQSAYENGSLFVKELKNYIINNIQFAKKFFEENNMNINFNIPEATYLIWLNFSKTNLSHNEIKNILLKKTKIALNDGMSFGNNADKYFRLNVALSKEALSKALTQLKNDF